MKKSLLGVKSDQLVEVLEQVVEEEITTIKPAKQIPKQVEKPAAEVMYDRLKKLTNQSKCMLFMKGHPDAPQCGFSSEMIKLLRSQDIDFGHFDILSDEEVRRDLKSFSDWPTYPQLYLDGELLGGLDIFKDMIATDQIDGLGFPKGPKKQEKKVEEKPVLSKAIKDRLASLISREKVMLFMKGDAYAPRCKFSRAFVSLMESEGFPPGSYGTFNILEDDEVRQSIKIYSSWPTFPQLYIKSDLIGGLDIVKELVETSEFQELFLD